MLEDGDHRLDSYSVMVKRSSSHRAKSSLPSAKASVSASPSVSSISANDDKRLGFIDGTVLEDGDHRLDSYSAMLTHPGSQRAKSSLPSTKLCVSASPSTNSSALPESTKNDDKLG